MSNGGIASLLYLLFALALPDMRRCLLYLACILLGVVLASGRPLHGQPVEVPDSVQGGWNVDLAGKLSGSQAAYRNWQEGGLNTLSITSTLDGRLEYESDRWVQAYDMRLSLGIVQQDTLAVRKAEDLIRLAGALSYIGDGFFRVFNPTIALGMRTQFAAGFNYDKDPFGAGRPPPVKTSDLFAPATLTQSLGLTYDAGSWFSERFSAASKETVVLIERLRPLYDVDPTRNVRYEVGVESVTTVNREVAPNVQLQSTLTLFKAVVQPSPVDVIWESLVNMRVNSWLNVGLEYVMLYDTNRSQAVQIKEVLSVGVSFEII
jgi:hypothetical protein